MTSLIALVLLMWQWMGLFLRKNHILICWRSLFLLNLIGALTSFLLLKLSPRKLEPWFVLWRSFLLRLLCITINLPCGHVWNTAAMFGLVLLAATYNCYITYKMDISDCWSFICCLSETLGSSSIRSQLKSFL